MSTEASTVFRRDKLIEIITSILEDEKKGLGNGDIDLTISSEIEEALTEMENRGIVKRSHQCFFTLIDPENE